MQAVILMAGKGIRMHPLTLEKPKALLRVAGKTILEHSLDQLLGLVDEVILVVGYKKEMIMERYGKNYKGIKLTYVVQAEPLGTGHALLQAEEKVKGKFLMLYGDDLYAKEDIERISKCDNCMLLKEKKDVSAFGVVVVKNGLVVEVVEKPKKFVSNLVNVGVFCFTLEIFEILRKLKKSERGEYEVTDAVKELAKQGKMEYEEVRGFWIPIGCPEDIKRAEKYLKKLEKKQVGE